MRLPLFITLALLALLPTRASAQPGETTDRSALAVAESPEEGPPSADRPPPPAPADTLDAPITPAQAQAQPVPGDAIPAELNTDRAVLLLAPASLRAEWTAALQIELAPRDVTVIPLEAPEGQTSLLRDAAAQSVLLERGALAAILVVAGEPAHSVRVLTPDAASARVAPVSVEADPRTAALIAVSLWEEEPLPAAPTPWYRRGERTRGAPTEQAAAQDVSEALSPATEQPNSARFSGRFGSGLFLFINNRRAHPGSLLHAGAALRYGIFEAELSLQGGVMIEVSDGQTSDAKPMLRGCAAPGFASEDDVQVHGGMRVCAGYAEARESFRPDPFSEGFFIDVGGWLLDVGGYFAVSFAVRDGLRLFVRADLGGTAVEAISGNLRASATLSAILAVE